MSIAEVRVIPRFRDDLPKPLPSPGDWLRDGACIELVLTPRDRDAVFFPETEEGAALGKEVCQRCLVREECLEYALQNDIKHGTWGGLSEWDRQPIRFIPVEQAPRYRCCPICEGSWVVNDGEQFNCLDCEMKWI